MRGTLGRAFSLVVSLEQSGVTEGKGFCMTLLDFLLSLVLIEKTNQTLKTVFDHISKHLRVRQKYSAARRIFHLLLGV